MTPDAALQLAASRKHLAYARSIAGIGIHDVAAREAYQAAFHAAEALVVERTGRLAKTHAGLRTVFTRLVHDLGGPSADAPAFLARAYELKAAADYGTDSVEITAIVAADTIEDAARLLEEVTRLLG